MAIGEGCGKGGKSQLGNLGRTCSGKVVLVSSFSAWSYSLKCW